MNELILLGRLTTDTELKRTQKSQYVRFQLAVDRDGEDATDFLPCVAFGKTAGALDENCVKGQQLLLKGRMQSSRRDDRTYYTCVASRIKFLQKPRSVSEK